MKSQKEFLKDIITALAQAGISYMVSGSISSTFYGQPRSTQDVDIIIEATLENLQELVSILQNKDYYADEEAALGVAIVQAETLDWEYMQTWARILDLNKYYQRLIEESSKFR